MASYSKSYARLNAAQKQAVDTIDGPVLVVAGPGTGKTQLLATRIAHILAITDAQPENILCLTFTDAAAVAMRERLITMVGQAAYNVTISTYHAFGSDLLKRYPQYFAEFADLTAADELLIDQLLRQVQTALPYSNPLKHEVFLPDIKALISDYKRALLKPADIKAIAQANQGFLAAAATLVAKHLAGLVKMNKASLPLFAALVSASKSLPADNDLSVPSLAELWQSSLNEAVEAATSSGKSAPLTAWKNQWLTKDEAGAFTVAGSDVTGKQFAAGTIYKSYLQRLKMQKLYDYDDMVMEAVQGLTAQPELRFTLQERYQYLLLDEFQDTNVAQLQLVQLLTDNPVNEGRPNVLAVGDDDQAIYAFQGARYSHMLEFYQHYRRTLLVTLTENYRSQPEILHLAMRVSSQITGRLHHNFPAINKQLVASSSVTPVRLQRAEFASDLGQYGWVAQQIKQLVAGGLPPSEIVVLAPKHKYLEPLLPFMQQSGLKVHYDKRENILRNPAISELLLMSRLVVALSQQDSALSNQLWPQVLSLPYWQIATSIIWQTSWQVGRGGNWTEQLCELTETKLIALFFIRLSLQASRDSLETSMDYIVGSTTLDIGEPGVEAYRSPFYSYYFGATMPAADEPVSFWHTLSDLTVLRGRLRSYRNEQASPLTLVDLLQFAAAHEAANIKILNTNPYQESDQAVKLMTTFKAKGQEFSAVFIISANDEVWGSGTRNQASRLSLPENLRFIRQAGATEDERLRLFYVAITRAKSQLYITNYRQDFSGKQRSRLKYLDEQPNERGEVMSPLLGSANQQVTHPDAATPPDLPELNLYWQGRHVTAAHDPKLRELLATRLSRFQLSATQLNRFTDVTIDGPTSFLMRDLLQFPSGSSIDGIYGDVIHNTLHWLQVQLKVQHALPALQPTINKLTSLIHANYLDSQTTAQLIERGTDCLQAYLSQRANLLQESDLSEYSFRQEGVFIGQAHLSGAIDRLILNDDQKTATVVDFKTGRSHSRWSNELKLQHYKQQLYFYKLLVENSHAFRDYVVTDAYLEFVQPDASGKINELHVNFDAQTMADFKTLISNVWQDIQKLDFPNVSNYPQTLAGVLQFQEQLIVGN